MNAKLGLRSTTLLLALLCTGPASAQSHDANCNPSTYTADQQFEQEVCKSHMGCRFTFLAQTACKAKDFLGKLGDKLTGRSRPDNWDVLDALNETEVPQTPGVRDTNAKVKPPYYQSNLRLPSYDRTNAAQVDWQQAFYGPPTNSGTQQSDGSSTRSLFKRGSDGSASLFEGKGLALTEELMFRGIGVQIGSKGEIAAGYANGIGLSDGGGVYRYPNGAWQVGEFRGGQLNGPGYTTPGDRSGTVMEGTFLNGLADGMMLVTWPDGSSRKEYWKDGKLVTAGLKVPKGQFAPSPQTPEQLAAAQEREYEAELAAAPSAGALYALADQWAEKGDVSKAKAAWRALLRRFPNSPLAERAIIRLEARGSAQPNAPANANFSSNSPNIDGDWLGATTGNRVRMRSVAQGIEAVALTQNGGQSSDPMLFRNSGQATYSHSLPDGITYVISFLGANQLRFTTPQGFDEIFNRQ